MTGEHANRGLAFRRSIADESAIVVIPRCVASVKAPLDRAGRAKFWSDTAVELQAGPATYTNVLVPGVPALRADSGRLSLGDVFEQFPVALLKPAQSKCTTESRPRRRSVL